MSSACVVLEGQVSSPVFLADGQWQLTVTGVAQLFLVENYARGNSGRPGVGHWENHRYINLDLRGRGIEA